MIEFKQEQQQLQNHTTQVSNSHSTFLFPLFSCNQACLHDIPILHIHHKLEDTLNDNYNITFKQICSELHLSI